MLRRIVLTATVSAAALVSAAAPVAGAAALPVPLPGLLSAPEPERDRLTVTVSDTGNARTNGRYELECDPAGGTHPAAEGACERLDQLAREGSDPFAPVPQGQMCTQQAGGPATARVTGTWHGRPVDATFNRTDGCEISRWQTMEPVLPSTRS
ncbi:SSI family serine proteinase inhibitor [Streptomyces sp. NPDC001985]|uniref:SSI family serine proteinase inhibitor n=1 Tax=Streptomyces sp. NPDC001985 TaxID=3154406 RepID=UPI00332D5AD0